MNLLVSSFLLFAGLFFNLLFGSVVKIVDVQEDFLVPFSKNYERTKLFEGESEINPRKYEIAENEEIIKIKVGLYMESLCPFCREFVKDHLYPTFMKISQYIQLDLIPFGNAQYSLNSTSGLYNFTCQHGEPECIGNMYLACVTYNLQATRPKPMMEYYKCLARSNETTIRANVKRCASKAFIDWQKLQTCVQTDGPKLLMQYGDRTEAAELKGVPTIFIDEEFNINDQSEIRSHFLTFLCKKLKGQRPKECKGKKKNKGKNM